MEVDMGRYAEIWCMNETECKQKIEQILRTEAIIRQQQLGMNYQPPDVEFASNVGPLGTREKAVPATQVIREVMSEEYGDREERSHSGVNLRTVKKILEQLSDETEFLLEDKLLKLLEPLDKDEKGLMKLDAIFAAIGVETEDDVQELAHFFLEQQDTAKTDEGGVTREASGLSTDTAPSSAAQLRSDRMDLVDKNDTVKALRKFVESHHKYKSQGKQPAFKLARHEIRDTSGDSAYWKRYGEIPGADYLKIWKGLLAGLEKYHDALTCRSILLNETEQLRQQNSELRMLLHQYVNSKVNTELEVPPTAVLQLQ